ncbi:reverse transcriptase domain-containing protein [Tanacetum coccineum]|uniref:Reverse transcriptase domain-containing protein n=1 Tax=Tanacetum coccineum TaxID=301880 RepID=A0ABQ5DMB9_9ASTR
MEDEFKLSVQPQRRVNPNIKEVVKKEVIKLLDTGLIYPISDSLWVSPVQVVPNKGGMTVVKNEKDELISQQTVTRWITWKPSWTISPSLVVLSTTALKNLEKMLKRCENTNLVLNWEKFQFMVKEGIVLGHKVSGSGIEVDKAKIKAISKLPYPTNVKAIRSFLGHDGFYKRFIKDFSQIACPMTQLLVKDAPFNFSEECILAFDTLKRELTQAPIMIKPDWSLPFEIMCDASDYAVGAVLRQRIDKHFKHIHYASKTINEAQENYTTTEKELLAVEFDIKIPDKKGAKNLAAGHLSRLENPDLGKLTRAKIRDLFSEERLMAISDKNDEPCVLAESYEDVWPEKRQHKFFDNVTTDHPEDIMASPPQQEKSSRSGFTGHISFAMHASWSRSAMHVSELETFHQGMKHLRNTSKSAKYSMYGGLILWDLSPHQTEINMYQSG